MVSNRVIFARTSEIIFGEVSDVSPKKNTERNPEDFYTSYAIPGVLPQGTLGETPGESSKRTF